MVNLYFNTNEMRKLYKGLFFILGFLIFLTISSSCRSNKHLIKKEEKANFESVLKHNDVKGIRKQILEEAFSWMGTPYKYAKSEKGVGADCSGVVMSVYNEIANIKLPRSSKEQSEFVKEISINKLLPGDLVFFATGKDINRISHVGIFIGDNEFIHASSSKGVVISNLNSPYYKKTFKKAGSILHKIGE